MQFMMIPALPRSKREGRRGSPRIRFLNMQPMTIILEMKMLTALRDRMMLKANVEPMMMRHSIDVDKSVRMTALTGISHPGGT
jgi:hypothetical protein